MTVARSAREVVTAHYVNAGAGNMEAAFADLSPTITWTEPAGSAYAGTFVGRPAVFENIFGRINAEGEGFGAIPDSIIADETTGTVAVVANYVDESIVAFEQIVDSALQNLSMN